MASFDEELQLDAEENAREIEYIRENLPADLKDKFSDADLLYIMECIMDYYFTSGILDVQPDKEGYVDIDLQQVADHICQKAAEENHANYDPEEIFFIVQADMDFQEENI